MRSRYVSLSKVSAAQDCQMLQDCQMFYQQNDGKPNVMISYDYIHGEDYGPNSPQANVLRKRYSTGGENRDRSDHQYTSFDPLNFLLLLTLTQSGAPGRVIGWTNFSH